MINFHIITPAYNCQDDIKQTLWSVFGQTYKNWHMTIIDDMSTDDTANVVNEFSKQHGFENKVSLISRNEKYGEVRNTLDICKNLPGETIVIRLDAGDWLTDLGCFRILKEIYERFDPAVLWTSHRWAWSNKNISGPINPHISLYKQPWRSSHLKTFKVKDFRGLNPENFFDSDGNYIMIACDQAVFLPMMERARRNQRPLIHLPVTMYHYSIDLEKPDLFSSERSISQKHSAEWIRARGYIE
jgi:glycosyltransferase involved in cell wall biosynthesis